MATTWKGIGRALTAALLLLAGCDSLNEPERPLRVLFIGNSHINWHDMPGMVAAMSDAAGGKRPLDVVSVAGNGMSLRSHWADGGTQLALTRQGPWDVVFIQGNATITEQGRAYLREHVRLFQGATEGKVMLMMPWPPRPAAAYFGEVYRLYRDVATETGATLVPAGEVWRVAMERDPALDLYDPDGGHPNAVGTYAAALASYQSLTRRSPLGLPATLRLPSGEEVRVDPAVATLLQESAAAVASAAP